ncbi:interferon-induced GTP-binding protein Mx3 isoform X3 [Callorhinchus milii]|uniref:interferon-induced GTP-binding protein Mx3 isoform X3 n=1 Tax=Callorhinchus milii TaxID=7868 RepID=UPI0004573DD3|nr:interferon-induced GTP-binding protein Mx3 isoform X3 [Callorhinchus milii]|eukprot:gi/632976593/ref/XP_007904883.1/ PREDICTED: interferon-induced GTP-binding protein Mx-like isoform X1 [Callorhinchus milii]
MLRKKSKLKPPTDSQETKSTSQQFNLGMLACTPLSVPLQVMPVMEEPKPEMLTFAADFDQCEAQATDAVLYSLYEEKIRPCIDLIDSLRALGVDKDLSLPAIAVIGDQSSGKSSVLEALSGVSLPRGTGIVTRCPLELKLKKAKKANVWKGAISFREYSKEITNASEVEQEIRKAQNSMAGKEGISHDLISLKIESSNVPDLTLIDLPGIARVAVGNQPLDIGDQIKKMIRSFINKQETINLVVVPCNVDIATTEALKMAQEVDPSGERTVGILTKPDLVDKGTESTIVDIVQNLVVELKKGYMIVKCRGQKEINDKLTLQDAIARENRYFEEHEQFRTLLDEKKASIPHLAERLTNELVYHISKCLPNLRRDVEEKLSKTRKELKLYGNGIPTSENERLAFLIDKITEFCSQIISLVSGEDTGNHTEEMRYFPQVRHEFSAWKTFLDDKGLNFQDTLRDEIEEYDNLHRGQELPGFVNYKTFESIMKDEIFKLEEPAIQKLKIIAEITRTSFLNIAESHFAAFSNLLRASKIKIEDYKQEQEIKAECLLRTHFRIESVVYSQDTIYSQTLTTTKDRISQENHKYSISSGFSFSNTSQKHAFGSAVPKLNASVEEMSSHLQTYYKIASNRMADQVPLIIRYYILKEFSEKLRAGMLELLQERDKITVYLYENADTKRKRESLKKQLDRLKRARQELNRFG